jgi:hypothetical protein
MIPCGLVLIREDMQGPLATHLPRKQSAQIYIRIDTLHGISEAKGVERQKDDVPANRSRSQRWNDWTQSSFPRLRRALYEWLGRGVREISNANASRCLLEVSLGA